MKSFIRRWPAWSGYAAAGWSLAYGVLGLYWALGGGGFPFGSGDPVAHQSLLGWMRPETGGLFIAAVGALGAVAGVAMARLRGPRALLLGYAAPLAAVLLIAVPTVVLMYLGYLPMLVGIGIYQLFGGEFDRFDVAIPWPALNQFICVAGGLLWLMAAIAYRRRERGACGNCGGPVTSGWASPTTAARWGRWAAWIAFIVPVSYAFLRYAWLLGFPIGIDEEFHRQGMESGLWLIGAGLGTFAVVGAVLTLGLIRPWGEIFPRWVVGLAGRPVPRALPIVAGSIASFAILSGGLVIIRQVIADPGKALDVVNPMLWFPAWGIALGAAVLAYGLRTRGTCRACRTAGAKGSPRSRGGGRDRLSEAAQGPVAAE